MLVQFILCFTRPLWAPGTFWCLPVYSEPRSPPKLGGREVSRSLADRLGRLPRMELWTFNWLSFALCHFTWAPFYVLSPILLDFSGAQRCTVSCHLAPWWIPRACQLSKIGSTVLVVGEFTFRFGFRCPSRPRRYRRIPLFLRSSPAANSANVFSQFKKPRNNFSTFL
jgi:hypothetical protein